MNKMNDEIEVKREQTFLAAITPENDTIRHLSMASIALLQRTNNKVCSSLLNNTEIDFDDREGLLEFIWCHVADKDEVIKSFLFASKNPYILKNAIFSWGLDLTQEQIDSYLYYILVEQKHIKNSESEVIPDKKSKKK